MLLLHQLFVIFMVFINKNNVIKLLKQLISNFILILNAKFIFSKLIQDYHILIKLINTNPLPNLIKLHRYIYFILNK